MRKRLISAKPRDRVSFNEGGLDLADLGMVEITSEDEAYPIECALQLGEGRGWRAAEPGPQIIRLLFDQAQELKHIWLVFEENEIQRTQEFALRCRRITGVRSEKLFASNGISAHPGQYWRLRITPWTSPT
jgi:hypothetical protein